MMKKTMNKTVYSWGHTRPFNSYAHYIQSKFGTRIQKISVHGNFTCPNRDGTKGIGGCSFCNNDAFITAYCTPERSIAEQIAEGKLFIKQRYKRVNRYFAYLQAYSNTYAPLSRIQALIKEIQAFPEIIGVIIGTRPDCIDNEKLDYFAELSKQYYVVIEYGVESVYNKSLDAINRGHDFACSKNAIYATAQRGIHVGAHMIIGLPTESEQEILASAHIISELPITSLKLHQLQIVKNTKFADDFSKNPEQFSLFTAETYIPFVANYLTYISPHIMIERLAGDSPRRVRIAPNWEGVKYETFVQKLEQYMLTHSLWQGKNIHKSIEI